MGDSKLAGQDDEITIELLALDLVSLIEYLQWKEVAICGFSMGGVYSEFLSRSKTEN